MKNDRLWALSLIVIGIAVIVLAGNSLAGMNLPDWLLRGLGVISLISLPVLVFTTIRKARKER